MSAELKPKGANGSAPAKPASSTPVVYKPPRDLARSNTPYRPERVVLTAAHEPGRVKLKRHPASKVLHETEQSRVSTIVSESLRTYGQAHPVVLLDDMILANGTTYDACVETGVPCKVVDLVRLPDDFDPVDYAADYMLTHDDLFRLTQKDRVVLAVLHCMYRNKKVGRPKKIPPMGEVSEPEVSAAEKAGERWRVGKRTIERGVHVLEHEKEFPEEAGAFRERKLTARGAADRIDAKMSKRKPALGPGNKRIWLDYKLKSLAYDDKALSMEKAFDGQVEDWIAELRGQKGTGSKLADYAKLFEQNGPVNRLSRMGKAMNLEPGKPMKKGERIA